VIQPDLIITGDANLLIEPEEKRDARSDLITRVLSIAVHVAVIAFLIFSPKIFPTHVPTKNEIELARKQLQWIYSPPAIPEPPRPVPKMNVDRNLLKKLAPVEKPQIPSPVPAPAATPEKPPTDLPDAPRARIQPTPAPAPAQPTQPAPSQLQPVLPPRPQNQNRLNLQLPDSSPGKQIQDQMNDAIRRSPNRGEIYSSGGPAPGQGGPSLGTGGVAILSDTQGVDFSNYITRLLAALRRNWVAIMPESAKWDKGAVYTTFQIYPNGSIASTDPELERTSGREPLDNAAMSAIHASNPFEPLPSQFHGPFLKLRIVFLYNIRPEDIGLR
jgi:outer membrane biosynthesis protein TonB